MQNMGEEKEENLFIVVFTSTTIDYCWIHAQLEDEEANFLQYFTSNESQMMCKFKTIANLMHKSWVAELLLKGMMFLEDVKPWI